MKQIEVSRATMGRIPTYLNYLKNASHLSENISATSLAKQLGLGEVQVRKDLGALSGAGRPKTGYNIAELTSALEKFVCADAEEVIVLVGAGKLGSALLDYGGFMDYGLKISAAFDSAAESEQKSSSGKTIYPMDKFDEFCISNNVKIGIITVPSDQAQGVCDKMVKNGIKAIWCFAPCQLNVPDDVVVQHENMALSLAYLNKKIH
ncbi:MAG: redox-sensing transcriptional repressor Rex [Clostridia bacterium]|nr:redox-sensing transcriptional repressor Rex [Clostridia bacterium]